MKNELPRVTASYFITLIKAYLQGDKTRQEIISETSGMLPPLDPGDDAISKITSRLMLAAGKINERFYFEIMDHVMQASDTTPTRHGLLHHLEAFIAGSIIAEELLEWSTTWYDEYEITETYFEDITVEYFCLSWLPRNKQHINVKTMQQVLEILRLNCDVLKERIALKLLSDKERQHFLFFLRDYADHHKTTEELDIYLMEKFGMDHKSFPYMTELYQVVHKKERLETLLQKAMLI